jgi:hypothetical protein
VSVRQKVTASLAVVLLVAGSSLPAIDFEDCSIRPNSSIFSSRVSLSRPLVVLSRLLPLAISTSRVFLIPSGFG